MHKLLALSSVKSNAHQSPVTARTSESLDAAHYFY